jgi:type IV secretion system protein TrbJ
VKRLGIVFVIGLLLVVRAPACLQAQGFGLFGGFATEVTQVRNHAQLLVQYIRQGLQLQEALRQTADMVRNTRTLNAQVFASIIQDINQLANIVQGGRALAYSMADLNAQFRSRFPGYGYIAGGYFDNYREWSQTSLDTTFATLRAAGLQGQQLQNEQSVLAAVRAMAQGAGGRMEALQVANQIAEQQVQQLMKLRELMLVDLQSKQAYQAALVQKEASTEAAVEKFFRYARQTSSKNTFQSGWK